MSASDYRPICDTWILARAKLKDGVKYYGAYLGGFPERARWLLGCGINDPVLHVCGGMARHYPYAGGFGPNDKTLDLDPACEPDFVRDAREPLPLIMEEREIVDERLGGMVGATYWDGILIDPPYSPEDASHYGPGVKAYPQPNLLLKNGIEAVRVGGRVGIIHYILPQPPKTAKFLAAIGVLCGFNNRVRVFSVFERRE